MAGHPTPYEHLEFFEVPLSSPPTSAARIRAAPKTQARMGKGSGISEGALDDAFTLFAISLPLAQARQWERQRHPIRQRNKQ
jgi:hypothetical protein